MGIFCVVSILGKDLKSKSEEWKNIFVQHSFSYISFLANVGFGLVVTLIRGSLACNTWTGRFSPRTLKENLRQNVVAYHFPPPGLRDETSKMMRGLLYSCTFHINVAAHHPLILTGNLIENHKKEYDLYHAIIRFTFRGYEVCTQVLMNEEMKLDS